MGAGGNGGAVLTLTNHSARTCTVYGYVGLQLVDANRRFMPNTVKRATSGRFHDHGPTPISLAPGQSAQAGIGYSDIPYGNESNATQCPPVRYLEVTPPDEKDYLFIDAHGIQPCEHGALKVTALQLDPPAPN